LAKKGGCSGKDLFRWKDSERQEVRHVTRAAAVRGELFAVLLASPLLLV